MPKGKQFCGNDRPHQPHDWSRPTEVKGETKQVKVRCPGVTYSKD